MPKQRTINEGKAATIYHFQKGGRAQERMLVASRTLKEETKQSAGASCMRGRLINMHGESRRSEMSNRGGIMSG